ncbi:MAG: hypothetical protein WAX04_02085 [Oscillospiraceae bacterium]
MVTLTTEQTKVEYTHLTDADIQYIEDMANFYDITRKEALKKFSTGNIEGNVLTKGEIDEFEKYLE